MPNFDINSRFNKEANFTQVVFGEDGYVLETELNEMQHIQEEARESLIREQIHSGFLLRCEPTTSLDQSANSFTLVGENRVNVNGNILTIPKNIVIKLSKSPTKDFVSITGKVGYREDLVFLEAWKEEVNYLDSLSNYGGEGQPNVDNHIKDQRIGVETTRRIQWKWRIRVADDVDFNKYPDGLHTGVYDNSYGAFNTECSAQGGNTAPVTSTSSNRLHCLFSPNVVREANKQLTAKDDLGVYVAGKGDSESKTLLKTYDGYCYAIPMFRVSRRNSNEYSDTNPNGSIDLNIFPSSLNEQYNSYTFTTGETITLTLPEVPESLKIGDYISRQSKHTLIGELIEIDKLSKTIKLKSLTNQTLGLSKQNFYVTATRPDNTYSNIIDARDILDLRRTVSLSKLSYKELLDRSINDLLKGQLPTKSNKKLLKTYHGVKKTPIDSNTVFYASFDNNVVPEIGELTIKLPTEYNKCVMPTGIGIKPKLLNDSMHLILQNMGKYVQTFTLDIWVKVGKILNSSGTFLQVGSGTSHGMIRVKTVDLVPNSYNHIRLCVRDGANRKAYVNGKESKTYYYLDALTDDNLHIKVGTGSDVSTGTTAEVLGISDVMVSNVYLENTFKTLPMDVILNEAEVAGSFSNQKTVLSDALTSQITNDIVKSTGDYPKHIKVTQATTGKWASGDKIVITALCNENISGLIDSDTATVKIVNTDYTTSTFYVDSLVGLSTNDSVLLVNKDMTSSNVLYIKIDDISTRAVTLYSDSGLQTKINATTDSIGGYIAESTSDSSSPLIRYVYNKSLYGVSGTWSGLGTSEATFTFGANANLTNQDIQIDYALNFKEAQVGYISVPSDLLCAEVDGKRLELSTNITVLDDFRDKVENNLIINPHTAYAYAKTNAKPVTPIESDNFGSQYSKLNALNGITVSTTGVTDLGYFPAHAFSFDFIRLVEDKYGEIPSIDKVKWLHDNVTLSRVLYYGYGTCGEENYVELNTWNPKTSAWTKISGDFSHHSEASSAKLINDLGAGFSGILTDKGKMHLLAFTKASDGVNSCSLHTDYISIEVEIRGKDGSLNLIHMDSFRGNGKSPILHVATDTREISLHPLTKFSSMDKIVTYGLTLPYQGLDMIQNVQSSIVITCGDVSSIFSGTSTQKVTGELYKSIHIPTFVQDYDVNMCLASDNQSMSTQVGIAEFSKYSTSKFQGIFKDAINKYLSFSSTLGYVPVRGINKRVYLPSNFSICLVNTKRLVMYCIPVLIRIMDELYMVVITIEGQEGTTNCYHTQFLGDIFRLKGRPLIKGETR